MPSAAVVLSGSSQCSGPVVSLRGGNDGLAPAWPTIPPASHAPFSGPAPRSIDNHQG